MQHRRSRIRTCDVADMSFDNAWPSDPLGKSVSPRAATAPLTPVKQGEEAERHGRPSPAGAAEPERSAAESQYAVIVKRGDEEERVDQVRAHEQRPRHRRIVGNESEQHEAGPDGRFGQDEQHAVQAPRRALVPGRGRAASSTISRPNTESSARPLVARCENSTMVAALEARGRTSPLHKGPVAAAARAGTGGADVGARRDHGDVVTRERPTAKRAVRVSTSMIAAGGWDWLGGQVRLAAHDRSSGVLCGWRGIPASVLALARLGTRAPLATRTTG